MIFISVIGVPIIIGAIAQTAKGRTGALWGLITFIVAIPWWIIVELLMNMLRSTTEHSPLVYELTTTSAVGVPLFVVMVLIVLTLPKKNVPTKPTDE
ncbi:MAG: hypothetical protein HN377_00175 [Alphaproteobacteria bacterium]|nr:hypothetical protein [Alphaproteobacteria bacterium]